MGGRYGDGEPPVLLVRVREPAVDGKANAAVRQALAEAFGVPVRAVQLLGGGSSRGKLLEVAGAQRGRLDELLAGLA